MIILHIKESLATHIETVVWHSLGSGRLFTRSRMHISPFFQKIFVSSFSFAVKVCVGDVNSNVLLMNVFVNTASSK